MHAAVPPIASLASTYRDVVVDRGHQPALLLLVAFGITFARASVRASL